MSPETLEALRGSIRKWEGIVAGTGGNGGAFNCPLCRKFNTGIADPPRMPVTCFGCPVQERTGEHGCVGSPYDEYEWVEQEWGNDEKLSELAKNELAFLKSLLPGQEPST